MSAVILIRTILSRRNSELTSAFCVGTPASPIFRYYRVQLQYLYRAVLSQFQVWIWMWEWGCMLRTMMWWELRCYYVMFMDVDVIGILTQILFYAVRWHEYESQRESALIDDPRQPSAYRRSGRTNRWREMISHTITGYGAMHVQLESPTWRALCTW